MRPLLVRSGAFAATVARRLAGLAIVRVGTDIHPAAPVIGYDLVEIGIFGAAQRAGRTEAITLERMILEVERGDRRVRRNRIDTLFAAGSEQLQRRTIVHLGV